MDRDLSTSSWSQPLMRAARAGQEFTQEPRQITIAGWPDGSKYLGFPRDESLHSPPPPDTPND